MKSGARYLLKGLNNTLSYQHFSLPNNKKQISFLLRIVSVFIIFFFLLLFSSHKSNHKSTVIQSLTMAKLFKLRAGIVFSTVLLL